MMKTPPSNQNQDRADDSENDSLRHFFTYLIRMRWRLRFVTSKTRIRLQRSNRICFGVWTACVSVHKQGDRQDIARQRDVFETGLNGLSAQGPKRKSQPVRHDGDDDTNPGHFQARCPPRTDGDQRFECANGKVCNETDSERSENGLEPAGKKERNDRNKRADRRGNAG